MGQATSTPTNERTSGATSGCPMHQNTGTSATPASSAANCPVDHTAMKGQGSRSTAAQCPVEHGKTSKSAQCPVEHDKLNPLNQMPDLANARQPGQAIDLPVERVESSIPRDGSEKWEYPSPQQFYNALVRKGWETPEEHVEVMVEIHNFLNEQAWQEVMKWEKRQYDGHDLELAKFKGRPGELSPKARLYMLAGWLLPSHFGNEPPFDRHDWIVRRPKTGEEVRYVIDYYSAPPEPDGSPAFSLDVRPALDSFGSLKERIAVATEEAWTAFREKNKPSTQEPRQH